MGREQFDRVRRRHLDSERLDTQSLEFDEFRHLDSDEVSKFQVLCEGSCWIKTHVLDISEL